MHKLTSMVRIAITCAFAVIAGAAGAAAVAATSHPAATPRPAITRTFRTDLPCAWPADAQQAACS
jgi:hypothetical protein